MTRRTIGPIAGFLLHAGGFDLTEVSHCGPYEQIRCVGIGATVIFTGVFAFISGFYALFTVFESVPLAAAIAVVWGTMIFNLDRHIVSSIVKHTGFWSSTGLALPRLALAIVLGVTVAVPLELRVFKSEIDEYLAQEKLQKLDALYLKMQTDKRESDERHRLRVQALDDGLSTTTKTRSVPIEALESGLKALEAEAQEAYERANCESSGSCGSGKRGPGPVHQVRDLEFQRAYNAVDDQRKVIALARARASEAIGSDIATYQSRIQAEEVTYKKEQERIDTEGMRAKDLVDKIASDSLLARIVALHAIASGNACEPLSADYPRGVPDRPAQPLAGSPPGSVIEGATHRPTEAPAGPLPVSAALALSLPDAQSALSGGRTCEERPNPALTIILWVSALFILVEVLPVFIRVLAPRGEYDMRIGQRFIQAEQSERDFRHKAALRENQRAVAKLESEQDLRKREDLSRAWHEQKTSLMDDIIAEIKKTFEAWRSRDQDQRHIDILSRIEGIYQRLFDRVTSDLADVGSAEAVARGQTPQDLRQPQGGDQEPATPPPAPEDQLHEDTPRKPSVESTMTGALSRGFVGYTVLVTIAVVVVAAVIQSYLLTAEFKADEATSITSSVSTLFLAVLTFYIEVRKTSRGSEQFNA